jgi:glycosyltransferase involved in cell wall biosynthesis
LQTKIVVAQLGSRQDYTVPLALQNAGMLERFYTDTYLKSREVHLLQTLAGFDKLRNLTQQALSRHSPMLDDAKVTRFNRFGVRYLKSLRQSANSVEEQYRAFINYGRRFNQAILREGLPDSTHLYAFDHAALDLFHSPKGKGRKRILDQIYPAIYEEGLECEEEEQWPGWARSSRSAFYQSALFREWREIQLEEWRIADTVIVASQYSRDAIATIAPEVKHKLMTVPLTVNLDAYRPYQHIRRYNADRPLRALFVGTVNLRKGLQYLLTAFNEIDPSVARLTVVGGIQLREERIKAYQDRIDFRGTIPHVQMPQVYCDADVFVFPTISDGFGAVMLEAMATGLPVISTDHCADIVEDGVNGFRIPIRSAEAITEKIYKIVRCPEMLEHLSTGAISTSQRFTLEDYQLKLCNALSIPVNTET